MHAAEQITDPLRGHRHRPTAAPAPALADTPQSPAPVMCRAVRGRRLSCARGSARSRHVTRRARRTGTDREPSHRLRGPHRAGMAMLGAGASVSNDAAVGVGVAGVAGSDGFWGRKVLGGRAGALVQEHLSIPRTPFPAQPLQLPPTALPRPLPRPPPGGSDSRPALRDCGRSLAGAVVSWVRPCSRT